MKYFKQILLCVNAISYSAYITHDLSGGRFGDNLLSYIHGKWVAYTYGIDNFLLNSFPYAEDLVLYSAEKNLRNHSSIRAVTIKSLAELPMLKTKNVCIHVPYFSEEPTEYRINPHWIKCNVNWSDQAFVSMIRAMISPVDKSLLHVELPSHCTTVALHMRRGGGYDTLLQFHEIDGEEVVDCTKVGSLLKFPPFSFYAEQLKRLSELLDNKKMYVFIFTDDPNPHELAQRLQDRLKEYKNISYGYRSAGNFHNKNVVEDFFAMTCFDCIIRPQSNYSFIAAKLKDYKIEIYPSDYETIGRFSKISKIETVYK